MAFKERVLVQDRPGGASGVRPPAGLTAQLLDLQGLELAILEWPAPPVRSKTERLTPAELDVAALVLEGLTNLAIAERRGRSVRTVANQLASIYAKLEVGSRAELAAWAARLGR